jgi:hypothetical protein
MCLYSLLFFSVSITDLKKPNTIEEAEDNLVNILKDPTDITRLIMKLYAKLNKIREKEEKENKNDN